MNVREKLVELLKTNACPSPFMCDPACRYYGFGDCFPDRFADYLIAHGVTVQEWISVKDRLPEAGGYVACIAKRNPFSRFMPMVARIEKNGWCVKVIDSPDPHIARDCPHFREKTNADRIRSMSDEELANLLTDFSNNGGWVTEIGREICYKRITDWLQQLSEEDDHETG